MEKNSLLTSCHNIICSRQRINSSPYCLHFTMLHLIEFLSFYLFPIKHASHSDSLHTLPENYPNISLLRICYMNYFSRKKIFSSNEMIYLFRWRSNLKFNGSRLSLAIRNRWICFHARVHNLQAVLPFLWFYWDIKNVLKRKICRWQLRKPTEREFRKVPRDRCFLVLHDIKRRIIYIFLFHDSSLFRSSCPIHVMTLTGNSPGPKNLSEDYRTHEYRICICPPVVT